MTLNDFPRSYSYNISIIKEPCLGVVRLKK